MLFLGIATLVLTVVPVVKIVDYEANHPYITSSDPNFWPTRLQKPVVSSTARLPDIYVIIPDDYARTDVLKQYFGYDDTRFIRALKQRGFLISEQGRSPYSDSEMNIAAALNMDYLRRLPTILGKKSQDVRPVRRLIADNRASRLLESLGYHYIHLDTDEVTFAAGNPYISSVAAPDSFENLWLQDTVLRHLGGPLGFNDDAVNERFRSSIRSQFSTLAAVPDAPGPKFVVFHTLLPHDPYIFGSHGQSVSFTDDVETRQGAKAGMVAYLNQLKFVSRKLLSAVDAIQAGSKTPPVIVIQADEGFEATGDILGEAAMRDVRVKGLLALYLPGVGKAGVPQPPNTVNTLRFIFNKYLGTHYKLLKSASYPELDFPYQFEEMEVK
jgi:hypothetical protein